MGRCALRATDFAALVGKAYESALAPLPFADFLPTVIAAIRADAALISLYAPELGKGDIPVAHQLPEEATRGYREHYWAIDPWRIEYQRRRVAGAATGAELMPFRAFEKTEIYNDQLGRHGFFDTCCGEIFRSGNAGAAISILRAKGRPFFGRREVAKLNRLLPHLERAFALHRRLAGYINETTALAAIIDRIHGGVVLCDRSGRVVYASEQARRIVEAGSVLFMTRNRLRARDAAADQALSALFATASDRTRDGAASHALVARDCEGRLALRLTIIRALPGTILDARGTGFAFYVLIDDLAEAATDAIGCMAKRYRLTPAEARLARTLAGGGTVGEAAEKRGVSVNTIRSQLQQIFQKTGVSRQAELIRLLLSARDLE